ncbi:MAG: hypothetical protein LBI33_09505 [Propionibacteriaceae bacterium]|nr:hypothetical protein [Propionibacteriaceae bacterium]
MSAMEYVELVVDQREGGLGGLHLVREGDVSARARRLSARAAAQARAAQTTARHVVLATVGAVFAAAWGTLVWAFLSVSNLP